MMLQVDDAKKRLEELAEYVKRAPRHSGFIYVIREATTGMVKIGYTLDPIQRFRNLVAQVGGAMEALLHKIGGSEPKFELITVVVASPEAERFIHLLVKDAQIGREWYRESQIIDAVVFALEILRLNNECLIVCGFED